ncbi:EF-hand domain-containing protein [Niveibacterium sp. SC-1]|uniref:EF-hand domain-containing protein n=1 Tax=Niveibacterium sp. SC-1 TaxID=3135646 RepID=UPI00311E63EE
MSTISGVSGSSAYAYQGLESSNTRRRPDPSQMASDLFDKLDSGGKGYIEAADLQSALSGLQNGSSTGSANDDADKLFSALGSDGDGKLTKQEMSDSLTKLADQMDAQFQQSRMSQAIGEAGGNRPPPPPPGGGGGDDKGMTKDQLSSMASGVEDQSSSQASDLNALVQNFDAADTDKDGKVSFKEAMAYKEAQAAKSGTSSDGSSTSSASGSDSNATLMHRLMQLAQAYGIGKPEEGSGTRAITTA